MSNPTPCTRRERLCQLLVAGVTLGTLLSGQSSPPAPVGGALELSSGCTSCLVRPAEPETSSACLLFAHADGAVVAGLGFALDLNQASAEDLTQLAGIGPVLADRMVAHRMQHGPYARRQALQAVSGVGAKTLQRLSAAIEVCP